MVWLLTSDFSMENSKYSVFGACNQWYRMNFPTSISSTSAFSVEPFQEKLNTISLSSTLSANHSCIPAGVERNSKRIFGEHLTGYSIENNCLLMTLFYLFTRKSSNAPCNDRKISLPKKYNLVFISNFFAGIFPKNLVYFHSVDNQLVTRVFSWPLLH